MRLVDAVLIGLVSTHGFEQHMKHNKGLLFCRARVGSFGGD